MADSSVYVVSLYEDVVGVCSSRKAAYQLIRSRLNGETVELTPETQRKFNLPDLLKFDNLPDEFIEMNHDEYKIEEFAIFRG